jgi:hypothetical protein
MPSQTEIPSRPGAPTSTTASSLDLLFEVFDFLAGLGIFTMALSPIAVPGIALLVVPLVALGLVAGLAGAALALPVLLVRVIVQAARRRTHPPRELVAPPRPTELAR